MKDETENDAIGNGNGSGKAMNYWDGQQYYVIN